MDDVEFLEEYPNMAPNKLSGEISQNHPLLAVDLLLLVNSDLFKLDEESLDIHNNIILLSFTSVAQRIRDYCRANKKRYKKDLLNRYLKQKGAFSRKIDRLIVSYLSRE